MPYHRERQNVPLLCWYRLRNKQRAAEKNLEMAKATMNS
jgi:hypothetical protein